MRMNGFYRAVVEENNDPEKLGRVRVRIWGLHSEKKNKTLTDGIPTNELPWAEPCLPIHEGISGYGIFGVPLQGSHVMVFFENGHIEQPRYFATLPGKPGAGADTTKGFNDPDGTYPESSDVSDYSELSRGVSSSIVTGKNANRDGDEPASPYDPSYPHNFVISTHGGLVFELDSTTGHKRFHIYHPAGTYIECDNDGNLVIKTEGTNYDINAGDKKEYVGSNKTNTIAGNKTEDITGNLAQTAGGTVGITASGNITITGANVTVTGGVITLAGAIVFGGAVTGGGSAVEISGTTVHLNKP